MTPRRQQTSMPANQPVRFYKFIALTFLLLTVFLLAFIVFMSSKRATITIETNAEPVDVTGVVKIAPSSTEGAMHGTVTSTVIQLSESFSPSEGKEIEAVATGVVTLHNDTSIAQALIPKTRLLSPENVLFRLKDRVLVPPNGTVEATVYADVPGRGGEIAPTRFTIPGLSAEKQKVIYAESTTVMSGGVRTVGIFGAEDQKNAERRLMEALLAEGKRQLSAGESALRGSFELSSYTVTPSVAVGTETSEITVQGTGTVVGVFYNPTVLKEYATTMLMKRTVDDTEVIRPNSGEPTVTVEEHDLATGTATLKVFYDGLATMNAEGKPVGKAMFFGKTKDEIRRYVLSLDHVRGVEVDFSPMWMRRVPHIADHVTVVVKDVE